MSPERTNAYRRVVKTLDELGPTKLLGAEQDRIRDAADQLIFTADLDTDLAAREALTDAQRLCESLVESGRWEQTTACRLLDDVTDCGPASSPCLRAA